MAGFGGVIVLDDSRDNVLGTEQHQRVLCARRAVANAHPAGKASLWMQKITDRMLRGGGVVEDPKTLKDHCDKHRRTHYLRIWPKRARGKRKALLRNFRKNLLRVQTNRRLRLSPNPGSWPWTVGISCSSISSWACIPGEGWAPVVCTRSKFFRKFLNKALRWPRARFAKCADSASGDVVTNGLERLRIFHNAAAT